MAMKMKFARGKNCKVFSDNIFEHEWTPTGEVTQNKDPMRNVKVSVTWYTVDYNGEKKKFGCAEISHDQYMFLIE